MNPFMNFFHSRSGNGKDPFSGDVTQAFTAFSRMFSHSSWGIFNFNFGNSGSPEAEGRILDEVGSYGRQIGRITDALEVLISTLDTSQLTKKQVTAIYMLKEQADAIRAIKSKTTNREYVDLSEPPAGTLSAPK
jgi:hypothetical protein